MIDITTLQAVPVKDSIIALKSLNQTLSNENYDLLSRNKKLKITLGITVGVLVTLLIYVKWKNKTTPIKNKK
jgi:hypothetical protein